MADLTQITIIGPYEAQFNTTPENLQPAECQAPPEIPGTFVLDPIGAPVIPTECIYTFPPLIPIPYNPFAPTPTPSSVVSLPFRAEVVSGLSLKVPGGRVKDKGNLGCDVDDYFTSCPPSTSDFKVWLVREDDTADDVCGCFTIDSGPTGWTGYPKQPNPPNTKYFELAGPMTSTGSAVSDLNLKYHGGDITWPSDKKIPFKCVRVEDCNGEDTAKILVPGGRVIKVAKVIDLTDTIIDLPYDETDHVIWLEMDDETLDTPVITVQHSASGWAGYPDQPNAPLTKYFELAKVDVASDLDVGITAIKLKWQGGDIIWPIPSASVVIKPFWLILSKNTLPDPDYTLRIIPGVINQFLPSNILTTIPVVADSVVWVWLEVITDGRAITAVTLQSSSTPPTQGILPTESTPPITYNVLLGVVLNNSASQIWTAGNISSPATLSHVEDRSPIVIGASPTVKWYTWAPVGV